MGSVRIGTINYYREIEDDARADNEEGLGRIVWVGQKLEAEHHNKIFSPFDKVELADGWSIENNGCPLLGSCPSFNAYLYCCSEVQDVEKISATVGGKGDSYLCIAKPKEFVASVTKQLRPIIIQDIMEHAPSEQKEQILRTLRILDITYRVNYDDGRKDRLVDEANVEKFDPMAFHPQDFFQKATSYSYEQETRTVWLPVASHPETGDDVPLSIYKDRKYSDIHVAPKVFSPELIGHGLNLQVSQAKLPGL